MGATYKLLEIKNLKVTYETDHGLVHAVENLNLSLKDKETLGFVGETGAGKTTTALAIMKLIQDPPGKIESGDIIFRGESLIDKSNREMRKIRGKEISMIFQDPMTSLDPVIKVINQVEEMIFLHKKVTKKEAKDMSIKLLGMVGIDEERVDDYPHQFSGGMKQRVVIAIALACNPKLLIADEPTTALDVTIQAQVLDLMKDLKDEFGTSMIMITHDLGVVAEICDTVAIMYAGSVVEYATKEEVFLGPKHPYTKGLFASIPNIEDENEEELMEIKGFPPDPSNLPVGCSFAPRCKYVMDKCTVSNPMEFNITDTHYVRCFLYENELDKG